MTYPQVEVQEYIRAWLVPLRLMLNRPADQRLFREYRVIWTPTIAILDRRGVAHYTAPGYLPPGPFLSQLRVGVARALIAWTRFEDAAAELIAVADSPGDGLAPEALYWLGVARYLRARRREPMMEAWRRLRDEYPASVWAARIPPNQETEPEF